MKNSLISPSITDRQDTSIKAYFREVAKQPLISYEEEKELIERIRDGDKEAIDKLVKANLRFVISIAKQYQNKGLPLIDLIQEGNIALIKAINHFDSSKEVKFITYAVWWIRQSIVKALSDQCRTVRIPMNQIVRVRESNKLSERFEQLSNQHFSNYNFSDDLEDINLTLADLSKSISLEDEINDTNYSLIDVLPNEDAESVESTLFKTDLSEYIEKILKKLPNRNSDVIRMSFGIGVQPLPIDEIAKRFGVCGGRIRQILDNTLQTIKRKYSKHLRELV